MRKSLFLGCFAMIGALLMSCSKTERDSDDTDEVSPLKVIELTKAQREIINEENVFAIDLFKNEYTLNKSSNIFISPFSAEISLYMLCNGAKGSTFETLVKGLGLENYSIEEINQLYNKLIPDLNDADKSTKLKVANSMWINYNDAIKSSYIDDIEKYYSSHVECIDFSLSSSLKKINQWCSDNTDGIIKDPLKSLNNEDLAMICNALYFKGKWKNEFDSEKTKEGPFYQPNGKSTKIKFMNQTSQLNAYFCEDYSACQLPFGNGAYELTVIMPLVNIGDFMSKFDSSTMKSFNTYNLTLSMPKFTADYSSNLLGSLMKMDIGDALIDGNDYSGIGEFPLHFSQLSQTAKFEVNEKGAEAAVVTNSKIMGAGASLILDATLKIDHPFIYAISEITTNKILFIGIKQIF